MQQTEAHTADGTPAAQTDLARGLPEKMADTAAYWKRVEADGSDFAAWVGLVAAAEPTAGEPEPLRKALRGLVAEWPLCFGYWKRYADHELAHSGEARAREVYEEAVGVCTHSVELWALYAAHAVQHFETPDKVRGLFERAVALVGRDYLAAPLWDRYIAFEAATADRNSADHARAGALYVRVLQLPLKALSSYWAKFQQWAATRSCSELLDEAAEAELRASLSKHGVACGAHAPTEGDDEGARKLRVLPLLEARYQVPPRRSPFCCPAACD